MLTEVQNDILAVLDKITANGGQVFKERGIWQGNLEELLKMPQKTPSAHVALASGNFREAQTIPPKTSPIRMGWDVIIVFQCLKDRLTASNQGYGLIESVVKPVSPDGIQIGGLTGLKTQGGMLWPSTLELLDTINGITAYVIRFEIERSIT
ncbi:MAG: hypothetical protein A2076_13165 [Geobacteraceae bacterium GWC2_53_11]|nr:MAG: hypothetical protein A2076_13165 [Geobacteraceae bacterium GWC2_53_11]